MRTQFLRLFLIHLLTLVALGLSARETVTFMWDPSPDASVIGYRLYWGTNSGVYQGSMTVENTNTCTFTNETTGTLFFVVTATDGQLESVPSNEISYQFKPAPPANFRVTVLLQSGTNLVSWMDRATFEMPVTAALNEEFWRARLQVLFEPPLP